MTADWDGKIRMDCSLSYAMWRLIEMRYRFDLAFGKVTDADRHAIVRPGVGLMKPNYYLAASNAYLFEHRPEWGSAEASAKRWCSGAGLRRPDPRIRPDLVRSVDEQIGPAPTDTHTAV